MSLTGIFCTLRHSFSWLGFNRWYPNIFLLLNLCYIVGAQNCNFKIPFCLLLFHSSFFLRLSSGQQSGGGMGILWAGDAETGRGTHCVCRTLRLVRTRGFGLVGRGRKSNLWARSLHAWFISFSCNSHCHPLLILILKQPGYLYAGETRKTLTKHVWWAATECQHHGGSPELSSELSVAGFGVGRERWDQWNWGRASGKPVKLALCMYFRATVERGFGSAVYWWMLHRLSQLDWYGTQTTQTWRRMSFIAWVPALSWVMWVLV